MKNSFEFIDWRKDFSNPGKRMLLESELDALKLRLERLLGNRAGDKIAEMESELVRIDKARPGLATAIAHGEGDAEDEMRRQATRADQLRSDLAVATEVQHALEDSVEQTQDQIKETLGAIAVLERDAARNRAESLFETDGHRLLLEARKACALFIAAKQVSGTAPGNWHLHADIWDNKLIPVHTDFDRQDIMPLIQRMRAGQ